MNKENALTTVEGLIEHASELLDGHVKRPGAGVVASNWIEKEKYHEFRMRLLSRLRGVIGKDHFYYHELEELIAKNTESGMRAVRGTLRSLLQDIQDDELANLELRLSDELFDDYLEQAESLHQANLKDAAAMVAGATLEQSVRKLAELKAPHLDHDASFNTVNQNLREEGVYNKSTWKQLDAWYAVRTDAAHGNFDEYEIREVGRMISGIRDFLASHFADY